MAIKYSIVKHGACWVANVLASEKGGGHIFSIKVDEDTDNGAVVKRGDWLGMQYYAEGEGNATTTGVVLEQCANGNFYIEVVEPGDGLLLYNVPIIEEEYNKSFQLEENFYNEAGSLVRGYTLNKGDIIELNAAAFDGVPVAKKPLTIVDKKWHVGA